MRRVIKNACPGAAYEVPESILKSANDLASYRAHNFFFRPHGRIFKTQEVVVMGSRWVYPYGYIPIWVLRWVYPYGYIPIDYPSD